MGLSSFNRMRRERNQVETIEAERFKIANEARNAARKARDAARDDANALLPAAADAEQAAAEAIGEKNVAGLKSDDLPLRKDHAAEIAGRNVENVQEPKDPVEARLARVPDGTVNEQLVEHMSVDKKGPSAKMVEAAAREVGALPADEAPADTGELTLAEGGISDVPTETPAVEPQVDDNEAGDMQEIADQSAEAPKRGRKPKATDGE